MIRGSKDKSSQWKARHKPLTDSEMMLHIIRETNAITYSLTFNRDVQSMIRNIGTLGDTLKELKEDMVMKCANCSQLKIKTGYFLEPMQNS